MSEVNTKIYKAFQERVKGLGWSIKILWPASSEKPPTTLPYVAISRLTLEPTQVLIDKDRPRLRTGTFFLNYAHPLGPPEEFFIEEASKLAAQVVNPDCLHFQDVCVTVDKQPHIQDGYRDEGLWRTPVAIKWRTFA